MLHYKKNLSVIARMGTKMNKSRLSWQEVKNMECKNVKNELASYAIDNMNEEIKKDVAAHLSACANCQRELAFLQATETALHELDGKEPPEWLWNKIEGKLYGEKKTWLGTAQIFLRPALAFTFALLLAVLSYLKFSPPPRPPQDAANVKALVVTEATFHAAPFVEQHYVTEAENPIAQDGYLAMLYDYDGEK